jgi:hypothetical protein
VTGHRRILVVALALGALVRCVNILQVRDGPLPYFHAWTESDMQFYDRWARELAAGDWLTNTRMRPYHSGHAAVARQAHAASGSPLPFDEAAATRLWDAWLGERTFYQDPLYAYGLGVVYAAGGGQRGAFVLQALLGLGCVVLLHALALRLFDPGTAAVTAFLAALYGPLAYYELLLLKPVLIAFTGLLSVLALLRALERPRASGRWAVAGSSAGLSVLAQSSAVLFVAPALVAAALWLRRRGESWGAPMAMAGAVFLATLSPVVARNLAVGAPPFVLSATGGWTFLNHNAEDYVPAVGDTVTRHAGEILNRSGGRLVATVAATIGTHGSFAGWLALLFGKLAAFWHWYEMPNNANYYVYRMLAPRLDGLRLPFSLLAPLALLGFVVALRRPGERVLLALHVLAGVATLVLFYNISRLRLPTAVAMIPFAAFGLVTLLRQVRARRWASVAAQGVLVAIAAALVLRPLAPGIQQIRLADYGVPNDITLQRARVRAAAGDARGALALLEAELRLEPADLAAADPRGGESRLSLASAAAAGSFATLHSAAAACAEALDLPDVRGEHQRRAAILAAIEAQFARARTPQ